MPSQLTNAAQFDAVKQAAAEADALYQLWWRTFPMSPATAVLRATFSHWLGKGLSFYELGKLIHLTEKLNDKYSKTLKPEQLSRYFRQKAALQHKGKQNG
jgi:hypothetical protein